MHLSKQGFYRFFRTDIVFFVVLACQLLVFGKAKAQQDSTVKVLDIPLSISFEKTPITEVLDIVSRVSGITIIYSNDFLPRKHLITANFENTPISILLGRVLQGTDLAFALVNNDIVLKKIRRTSSSVTPGSKPGRHTLSGKVQDAETGEDIIGAALYAYALDGDSSVLSGGSVANQFGFYSLSLPTGHYALVFSSVGYAAMTDTLHVNSDLVYDMAMVIASLQLQEVTITASDKDETPRVETLQMSQLKFDQNLLRESPTLMGEPDVLRTLQLLPGIQSASEGNVGFFVRGGGADQNLVLLDGAPLYNVSHLLGFFSIFNPDAIRGVEIYKGAVPARYGGRISSVLDVRTRDGNRNKTTFSGGIGSIASRLTFESPFDKGNGTFMVTGRRSYIDLFFNTIPKQAISADKLFFYDINVKTTYKAGEKNKFSLSFYNGLDRAGISDALVTDWGNTALALGWNLTASPRLFVNTDVYSSNFRSSSSVNLIEGLGFQSNYNLGDLGINQQWTFFAKPQFTLEFGFEAVHRRYNFGEILPLDTVSVISSQRSAPVYGLETAAFISAEHGISKKLKAQYGLRYSSFSNVGPGRVYLYNTDQVVAPGTSGDNITDTLFYNPWDFYNNYHGPEPRLQLRYLLKENSSLKASYSRTRQYLHRLSNSTVPSPADMWAPVNPYIRPQIGDQLALGYFHNFTKDHIEFSAEIYYKHMANQIDFKPLPDLFLNDRLETEVLSGEGRAYGLELMVEKNHGKLNGWISYTLSRTVREISGINNGLVYPASFDRRHDISVVLNHHPNKRVVLSANWVFASGLAYTFPVGKYEMNGFIIPYYTSRNAFRLPPNRRMDVSVTVYREEKPGRKNNSSFNFSIYNLYARRNTYAYIFRQNAEDRNLTEAVKLYLFTIIPSFTYNFKF